MKITNRRGVSPWKINRRGVSPRKTMMVDEHIIARERSSVSTSLNDHRDNLGKITGLLRLRLAMTVKESTFSVIEIADF